jgi:hypothetical protein
MIMTLSFLLLLSSPFGEEKGFVIERDVELILLDPLDRKREIHRRERVSYQEGNLLMEDLTFGEKILIRTDQKAVWVIDTLAGTWSRLGFSQIRTRQEEVLRAIRETRKRVPGTQEEKAITQLLEGYGWFDQSSKGEIRTPGKEREILGRSCVRKDLYLNGNIRRLSVYVDPSLSIDGYFDTLSLAGRFSKEESSALKDLGGVPMEGVLRYVSFLDRVRAQIRVISVTPGECSLDIFTPPTTGKQVPLARFEKPVARKIKRPEGFEPSFREDDLERENDGMGEDQD